MAERINNSKSIKQRHKEIYQNLYSSCFIVVSTPVKFFWAGEYGAYIGSPLIGQNLPLRAYVGLEYLKSKGKIEIIDKMYIPSRDNFIAQMDQIHRKNLERYLRSRVEQWLGRPDFQSLRIHSICEVPPGNGMGASGSFASALSVALQLHIGRILLSDIDKWSLKPTYLLSQIRSFDRAQRFSWKISSLLHDGISSGGASFLSFIGSIYPIIYYSEKRAGYLATPGDVRVPLNIDENYNLLDRLFYGGIKLDELFKIPHDSTWPLEIFLVFSGERGGGRSAKSIREIDNNLMEIDKTIKKSFNFLSENQNVFSPIFYQQCLTEGWEGLHKSLLGTNATLTLFVLLALKELFEMGGSERSVTSLCQSINSFQKSLRILRRTSPTNNRITHIIKDSLRTKYGFSDAGVKMTGAGRGGDIVVVVPGRDGIRELNKIIIGLRRTIKETINLDYSSSRDGFEEKGVIVEQMLSQDVYSNFISKGSVVLDMFSKTGKTSLTMTMEQFEGKRDTFPLFFDLTTKSILIHGHHLDSKELKSAIATIKIFKVMADHLNESLDKTSLPVCSYTADRNELQSKIITPLQKAIKTKLQQSLPINLQGPIRKYTIKMESPQFEVYFLVRRI
ncbi:MAG: hypothetical protein V1853_00905 [bacterium]